MMFIPARYWMLSSALSGTLGLVCACLSGCGNTQSGPVTAQNSVASDRPETKSSLLSTQPEQLKQELDQALEVTFARKLSAEQHAAWQIVHGIMAFGPEFEILVQGKPTRALEWLLAGGRIEGWNFAPGDVGLKSLVEPGTKTGQGHPDQWLGYLNHCGLADDVRFHWAGKDYRLVDLRQQTLADLRERQEASWTLMALAGRVPTDVSWQASDGQTWNLAKIVKWEAAQDLPGSACGGSHRLYGLNMALQARFKEVPDASAALTAEWSEARQVLEQAVQRAQQFQDPRGAFSANYFERPTGPAELDRQLGATGHVLEFLVTYLDDARLREPWVEKAARFLCRLLQATKDQDLECGGLYHAAHGLYVYRTRLFGPWKPTPSGTLGGSQ